MRKGILAVATAGAVVLGGLAACGKSNNSAGSSGGAGGKAPFVGVILPDSKTSARWEGNDRPYLEKAFQAAGVKYDIENAQGDKNAFQTLADQLITKGVNVLVIVNLDSGTGKAVLDKAKAQGIATIDYDRLTLGGGADFYDSFDNTQVGALQGQGLLDCLTAAGKTSKPNVIELAGSPTDNNATLFSAGAHKVLDGKVTFVDSQKTPDWDPVKGSTIFQQELQKAGNKVDGVLAANDTLGNAVITILKSKGIKAPVTGQDAGAQGLTNILAGDQCMTVYKPSKLEAESSVALAKAIMSGGDTAAMATGKTADSKSGKDVPSVLNTPILINKANVAQPIKDGVVKASDVCTAAVAAACKTAGISS